MAKLWPRRRDVRDMLLTIHHLLDRKASYDELAEALADDGVELIVSDDFDRHFLTEVRDLMRDGTCLADALLVIAAAEEPETQVNYAQQGIAPPPHIGDRQAFYAGAAAAAQQAQLSPMSDDPLSSPASVKFRLWPETGLPETAR